MAVCQTIRTKIDIAKFLIQSENGDEPVTAFMYKDKKVEVHSLKTECNPLYLEESTSVELISHESFGKLLVSFTPKINSNSIEVHVWDISIVHGFMPKDVSVKTIDKKENIGKLKYTLSTKNFLKEDLEFITSGSLGSLVCLILNGKFCILLKAQPSESGGVLLDLKSSFALNEVTPVSQAMFLKTQQSVFLLLAETTTLNVLSVNDEDLVPCNVIPVPMKKSQGSMIHQLYKITSSKCLVIDNVGHMSLFSAPSELTPLKFPSSFGGHSVCSAIGFKHTSEGVLAICNGDYTLNFYSLADIICSVSNGTSVYVKPYRVFCSQFPINAINFIKSDQLALVSSVNQSITFLGGFSKGNS